MKDLQGKVAVVTGAAAGIGRALAERFADEGMKVALADVEEPALRETTAALEGRGAEVLAVTTDVTRAEDVQALADKTLAAFGSVHVVCNNAGVFAGGHSWEMPIEDYAWVLEVNMWGVIHGIRTFVPILIQQDTEAHVVNTASMAGVTALPLAAAYHMSKHAVLALSECLHHELTQLGSKVKVSALCPEMVATSIDRAERNRPDRLKPASWEDQSGTRELVTKAIAEALARGVPPAEMADRVVRAIREERFYILSEDGWRTAAHARMDAIREGRNPSFITPLD
jgi:NAD(P)-dependent dehydrogenase (short-subunit alcohol dehydrogenase family)